MFLDKLKEFPKNLILLIITIVGFLIFILINQLIFIPLAPAVPTYNVLDFEFAWTSEKIQIIFAAWGPAGMTLQIQGVYWDFLYIVGYGLFIFGCILLVSRILTGRLQKFGLYICLTPLIAGVFDLIENVNLLIMLDNPTNFPTFIPFVASLSAVIKFGFLFIGIIFFFIALILIVIALIRKKS